MKPRMNMIRPTKAITRNRNQRRWTLDSRNSCGKLKNTKIKLQRSKQESEVITLEKSLRKLRKQTKGRALTIQGPVLEALRETEEITEVTQQLLGN